MKARQRRCLRWHLQCSNRQLDELGLFVCSRALKRDFSPSFMFRCFGEIKEIPPHLVIKHINGMLNSMN